MNNKKQFKITEELTILTAALGIVIVFVLIILGIALKISVGARIALFVIAIVLGCVAFLLSGYFNWKSAKFVCPFCGNIIKPTYWELLFAPQKFTKAKLKCRKCDEISWCERQTKK